MSKPTVEIRQLGLESGWVVDIQKHYGIMAHIAVVSQWSGGLQVVESEEEIKGLPYIDGGLAGSTEHKFCPTCGRPATDKGEAK